jgi:hypothetical protein
LLVVNRHAELTLDLEYELEHVNRVESSPFAERRIVFNLLTGLAASSCGRSLRSVFRCSRLPVMSLITGSHPPPSQPFDRCCSPRLTRRRGFRGSADPTRQRANQQPVTRLYSKRSEHRRCRSVRHDRLPDARWVPDRVRASNLRVRPSPRRRLSDLLRRALGEGYFHDASPIGAMAHTTARTAMCEARKFTASTQNECSCTE